MTISERAGWDAYHDGCGLNWCPYKNGTQAEQDWLAGWHSAHRNDRSRV